MRIIGLREGLIGANMAKEKGASYKLTPQSKAPSKAKVRCLVSRPKELYQRFVRSSRYYRYFAPGFWFPYPNQICLAGTHPYDGAPTAPMAVMGLGGSICGHGTVIVC
jgi:hypothetical protein